MTEWHVQPLESPEHDAAWNRLLETHALARCIVPMWEVLAGWENQDVGLFKNGNLVGGMTLSIQRIPYTTLSLSRINMLMVGPGEEDTMLRQLLAFLERYAKRHFLFETELRLRLAVNEGAPEAAINRKLRQILEEDGYRPLSKVDCTYFVPLDQSDETLLQSFDRSARNKIRKALRSGVKVELSQDFALLDDFYAAYVDMCERKQAPFQPSALVGGLRPLIERGHVLLFTEIYPQGISNMVIVDALGIPCYTLGTRSPANVQGKVPGAAQVVQYEIMKAMRDRGHPRYDLGGCEGPVPVEGHPNFGVWRFKYGFSGDFVRFIPFMRKVRGPKPIEKMAHVAHVLRGDFV